jgi:hypothetical protein
LTLKTAKKEMNLKGNVRRRVCTATGRLYAGGAQSSRVSAVVEKVPKVLTRSAERG